MITKLTYNWHQVGNTADGLGDDYYVAEVGKECYVNKLEVKEINEHRAAGEGDKWYYDVVYANGTEMRIFNPSTVLKTPEKSVF